MYGIGGGIEKFKSHELRLVKCALVDDKIRFCHKKLRNVIQAITVLLTFSFKASQKSPMLVL